MKAAITCLILLSLFACKPAFVSNEDLISFVDDPDNGLRKTVSIGGNTIIVTHKPTDLLVYQETKNNLVDFREIQKLRKNYDQNLYFTLSLSRGNKEALHQVGPDQFSDLVRTLSFEMANYVTVTTSSADTIPVSDFILNRTFGYGNRTNLLFVFSNEKSINQEWIQFNLNEFGMGTGNQRFRFAMDDLEEIPKIKF
jgi:hypothetical protein